MVQPQPKYWFVIARGNQFFKYLCIFYLVGINCIRSLGTKPTFVTSRRQDIIDLTLYNSRWGRRGGGLSLSWRVLSENSLSDHMHIAFQLVEDATYKLRAKAILKKNRLAVFWGIAIEFAFCASPRIRSTQGIEEAVVNETLALSTSLY